jgi:hypothetical protein
MLTAYRGFRHSLHAHLNCATSFRNRVKPSTRYAPVESAEGVVKQIVRSLVWHCDSVRVFLSSGPRFPKEYCVLQGTQASPVCPGKSNIKMKMNVVQR